MTPDVSAGPVPLALLSLALFICAFCCLALVVMKGFYAKLHYLAPAAALAGTLVAAAVALQEGMGANAIKAGLVLLVLLMGNPVITFAAARAHYLRQVAQQRREEQQLEEELSQKRRQEAASKE